MQEANTASSRVIIVKITRWHLDARAHERFMHGSLRVACASPAATNQRLRAIIASGGCKWQKSPVMTSKPLDSDGNSGFLRGRNC
jgi:hypothetical protein